MGSSGLEMSVWNLRGQALNYSIYDYILTASIKPVAGRFPDFILKAGSAPIKFDLVFLVMIE